MNEQLKIEAVERTLVLLFGAEGAQTIAKVGGALHAAMESAYAAGSTDGEGRGFGDGYVAGLQDGRTEGYEAARQAFYSDRQPDASSATPSDLDEYFSQ